MTPEGKVKTAVKRFLRQWDVWTDWPVPSGYGKSTLDCMVICKGQVMWIETKAPGQKPTERQQQIISILRKHGCKVVVVDTVNVGDLAYREMCEWVDWVMGTSP
jgi:hypothetical protein